MVTGCDVDVFTSSVLTGSCSYVLIDWVSSQQPSLLCLTRSGWGGFAYSLNETSMKMRGRPSLILADIGDLASIFFHCKWMEIKLHFLRDKICCMDILKIKWIFYIITVSEYLLSMKYPFSGDKMISTILKKTCLMKLKGKRKSTLKNNLNCM